jgi:hypothetical protein
MRNVIIFSIVCAVLGGAMLLGKQKRETHTTAPISVGTAIPSIGRIQVLNGCGTPGLSWIAVDELRQAGFDVKNDGIGNAEVFNYPSTFVISRILDMSIALQVGATMHLSSDKVFLLRTKDDRFDVTVILGADYQRKNR